MILGQQEVFYNLADAQTDWQGSDREVKENLEPKRAPDFPSESRFNTSDRDSRILTIYDVTDWSTKYNYTNLETTEHLNNIVFIGCR